MTVPPLTPPPWEHIGFHLKVGAYLYVSLIFLAVGLAYAHRTHFFSTIYAWYIHLTSWLGIQLHVAAMADVYVRYAFHLAVLRMLISTAICVTYVYITYIGHIYTPLLVAQRVVGATLLLQFVSKLVVSVRPIRFILGGESVMEVFSLSCLIMASHSDWLTFSFLQAYIILSRYFTIEPTLEAVFMLKSSPFHRQLTRLTLEFIVFIYVFACGLQLFERLGEPWETFTATTFELTLANSFYFTVVTIFTVGYGDFVPFTLMGRLWIIFIIVFGAYLVSRKIGQVVDVLSGLRRGLGSFVKAEGIDHCVICGHVKWEYLKSFVEEFYGDERNLSPQAKKLVVICDQPNWSEETWNKFFSSNALFKNNVTYLEGTCVSRDDLVRAQVETAKAVFVLNNHHSSDPYAEDSETLKRILTIRSYTPTLPIYSMCALRDSMLQISYAMEHLDEAETEHDGPSRQASMATGMNLLQQASRRSALGGLRAPSGNLTPPQIRTDFSDEYEDDDGLVVRGYDGTSDLKSEAICMQEVETSILAENVFCNGLSTLLANLILRVNPVSKPSDQCWAIEYKIGSECRFEYVKIPMRLHHRKFSEIALVMYDYGILLIATKRFMESKWKAVTPDTVIHLNTIGLVITYHSTQFLDRVMGDVVNKVAGHIPESESAETSQSVPSIEDEFSSGRDVPRHTIAGGRLTGDLTVMYESGEDAGVEGPAYASSYPEVGTAPAVIESSMPQSSLSLDEYSAGIDPSSAPAAIAGRALSESPLGANSVIDSSSHQQASVPVQETDTHADLLLLSGGPSPKAEARTPMEESGSILAEPPPPHVSTVDLLAESPPGATASKDADAVPEAMGRDSFDGSASDSHDQSVGAPPPTGDASFDQDVNFDDLMQSEAVQKLSEEVAKIRNSMNADTATSAFEPEGMNSSKFSVERDDAVEQPKEILPEQSQRQKRGQYHVSFPNQTTSSSHKLRMTFPTGGGSSRKAAVHYPTQFSDHAEGLRIFYGEDELPIKVKGHIVVCAIGQMGVLNLKHFLQRTWIKRGASSKREFDGRTTVVAICPRITEDDEAQLSVFTQQLFVIQGNSLSVKTLKRAQYDKARAIVILACEDKNDVDHMDAKAIFTVMTLDYLLPEKSETFVCTMLDAEESMQLLRAPSHARRRGARLGAAGEEYMEFANDPSRSRPSSRTSTLADINSYPQEIRSLMAGRASRARAPPRSPWGGKTSSFGATTGASRIPQSMSFIGIKGSTYTDRREAIGRLVARNPEASNYTQQVSTQISFGAYQNQMEEGDDNILNHPSLGGASALNFLWNPSTLTAGGGPGLIPGEAGYGRMRGLVGHGQNGARDESFEKQRYASGEMMISSTYMALLIREYAMPGLTAVVRKIFGAGVGKHPRPKRCWIRTISVPRKWIHDAPESKRTYRELFEVLLCHGAVALGLYRSGDATVRIQLGYDLDADLSDDGRSVPYTDSTGLDGDSYDEFSANSYEDTSDGGYDSGQIEIGGEVPHDQTSEGEPESSPLMQRMTSYGSIGSDRPVRRRSRRRDSGRSNALRGEETKLNIPAGLLFDIAEDVQTIQKDALDSPGPQGSGVEEIMVGSYTCPTHGRRAMFKEVPGGDNVLPYVYTNPEPYTLVSEHDAVYVLVPPTHKLPEPDEW